MGIFKKIFRSYDFRNNKIINVKTDTPTNPEHITNKDYVDSKVIYNTALPEENSTSFVFPWAKNLFEKTFKQVFDDLLFPQINPEYYNPEIKNISFEFDSQIINNKYLLFKDITIPAKIKFTLKHNDRDLIASDGDNIKLEIKTLNNNYIFEIYGDVTANLEDTYEIDFDFKELGNIYFIESGFDIIDVITAITLSARYGDANKTKQDTYGNNYTPVDFTQVYTVETELYNNVFDNNILVECPLFQRILTEGIPTYGTTEDILSDFKTFLKINVTNTVLPIIDLLIPKYIIDNYPNIKAVVYNSENEILNTKYLQKNWITYYTNGDEMSIASTETIYKKYQYNFGVYNENIVIKLFFEI